MKTQGWGGSIPDWNTNKPVLFPNNCIIRGCSNIVADTELNILSTQHFYSPLLDRKRTSE
jgi:hypothetical protein